jgi:NhaP-type Na+/H+ or K+/H+ antiporter
LLLVLPPVIYSSAVAMSWREFRFNLRPISLLAVGCVAFTTVAVAAATHMFLNLPWPVGFALGAIVSPPDAVAPLSVLRRMQLPKRLAVILEGEGLANDATALILYRFAVVAVSVGSFSIGRAAGSFAAIVVGEFLWGLGVGCGCAAAWASRKSKFCCLFSRRLSPIGRRKCWVAPAYWRQW